MRDLQRLVFVLALTLMAALAWAEGSSSAGENDSSSLLVEVPVGCAQALNGTSSTLRSRFHTMLMVRHASTPVTWTVAVADYTESHERLLAQIIKQIGNVEEIIMGGEMEIENTPGQSVFSGRILRFNNTSSYIFSRKFPKEFSFYPETALLRFQDLMSRAKPSFYTPQTEVVNYREDREHLFAFLDLVPKEYGPNVRGERVVDTVRHRLLNLLSHIQLLFMEMQSFRDASLRIGEWEDSPLKMFSHVTPQYILGMISLLEHGSEYFEGSRLSDLDELRTLVTGIQSRKELMVRYFQTAASFDDYLSAQIQNMARALQPQTARGIELFTFGQAEAP